MRNEKPFTLGTVNGTIYDFEAVGDTLPMHTHGLTDVHISIVARGSFRAHGGSWDKTFSAGDLIDWQPFQSHEFIALEPNSRLINIVKT